MDDNLIMIITLVIAVPGIAFAYWRWRLQRRFMQRSHKIELELLQKRHELRDAEEKLRQQKRANG